jgi:hypothetical protein
MYKPELPRDETRREIPITVLHTENIEYRRNHFPGDYHVCSMDEITLGSKNGKMQAHNKNFSAEIWIKFTLK